MCEAPPINRAGDAVGNLTAKHYPFFILLCDWFQYLIAIDTFRNKLPNTSIFALHCLVHGLSESQSPSLPISCVTPPTE